MAGQLDNILLKPKRVSLRTRKMFYLTFGLLQETKIVPMDIWFIIGQIDTAKIGYLMS